MPRRVHSTNNVLAAIDVGTNAVRLELARVLSDGSLETLYTERDPIRIGEGLFRTGIIRTEIADRLVVTLRRYAALCKRYAAQVRTIATSALREAKNRDEIVQRIRRDTELNFEVISGHEEARLICLGVLHGTAPTKRSLCVDIGGGSTEIILAQGEVPEALVSIDIGAVRLTELFELKGQLSKKQLALLRSYTHELIEKTINRRIFKTPQKAIGSSGTVAAIINFASAGDASHATTREISNAVEVLAAFDARQHREAFDPQRADIIVAGAVILEEALKFLKVRTISAVHQDLRKGLLIDLVRRRPKNAFSLKETVIAIGHRFTFSETHARQVATLALTLFDRLASMHSLPSKARLLLEVAALLHDIGHAVSDQRHHKHTEYLIANTDIPGFNDRERAIIGAIARFHRRSRPNFNHGAMQRFTRSEMTLIRKCATLLRIADSLDRSHHQPVKKLQPACRGSTVTLTVEMRGAVDLELWDVSHEKELFREVFARTLRVKRQ